MVGNNTTVSVRNRNHVMIVIKSGNTGLFLGQMGNRISNFGAGYLLIIDNFLLDESPQFQYVEPQGTPI